MFVTFRREQRKTQHSQVTCFFFFHVVVLHKLCYLTLYGAQKVGWKACFHCTVLSQSFTIKHHPPKKPPCLSYSCQTRNASRGSRCIPSTGKTSRGWPGSLAVRQTQDGAQSGIASGWKSSPCALITTQPLEMGIPLLSKCWPCGVCDWELSKFNWALNWNLQGEAAIFKPLFWFLFWWQCDNSRV